MPGPRQVTVQPVGEPAQRENQNGESIRLRPQDQPQHKGDTGQPQEAQHIGQGPHTIGVVQRSAPRCRSRLRRQSGGGADRRCFTIMRYAGTRDPPLATSHRASLVLGRHLAGQPSECIWPSAISNGRGSAVRPASRKIRTVCPRRSDRAVATASLCNRRQMLARTRSEVSSRGLAGSIGSTVSSTWLRSLGALAFATTQVRLEGSGCRIKDEQRCGRVDAGHPDQFSGALSAPHQKRRRARTRHGPRAWLPLDPASQPSDPPDHEHPDDDHQGQDLQRVHPIPLPVRPVGAAESAAR